MVNDEAVTKRLDGTYEERLDDTWLAVYMELPDMGLWRVEVFNHNVSEWVEEGLTSLEEARQSASNYWDTV